MRTADRWDVRSYLDRIGAVPLLTAEQERDLAARVAGGDAEARDRLVRANLRLVASLARRYAGLGVAGEDLMAEGNLGLMRAAEGYDGRVGARFATFAAYWIRQSMRRAVISHGRAIRLPAHAVTLVGKWKRAEAALGARLGRAASDEEVGAALGLSGRKRATALEVMRSKRQTRCPDAEEGPALAGLWGEDGGPLERMADAEEVDRVRERLGGLEARSASVVRMRFGLGDEGPMTLREVGERLGLTRERVRQLEREALVALAGTA